MKQTFRHYGSVVVLLACILALSVGVTALLGGFSRVTEKKSGKTVLATTYPLYVAAQRIIGDDDTITLTRLDGAASGCLHDYQMSPSDRRGVQEADLILMNGVGAESFLHGMVDEAKCVDTSATVDLICSSHDHDHGEGDHHHHEEYNEHVWLSPRRYMAQVEEVLRALCLLNPEMTAVYEANAYTYYRKIDRIAFEIEIYRSALSGKPCILFHDSMSYFAADLGLDVRLTLSVEGESGLSAADLGQVEALAAQHPDLLLFYDTQYALRYDGVAGTPISIRTAVQEDWLTAMEENLKILKQIARGGDAK